MPGFDLTDWLVGGSIAATSPTRTTAPITPAGTALEAPEPAVQPRDPTATGADGDDDDLTLGRVPGVVALDLAQASPAAPYVLRVGTGPLPGWCATRPLGVRWSSGWWTDASPLPPRATRPPSTAMRAKAALPRQAAGRWAALHGQVVDHGNGRVWAWVLALGPSDEPVGAFHVPARRADRLLRPLGAAGAGMPPEGLWSLRAGETRFLRAA